MKRVLCFVLTVAMLVALMPAVFAANINNSVAGSYVSVTEDFANNTAMASAHAFPDSCKDLTQLATTRLGDSGFYAVAPTAAYAGGKYTSSVNTGQITADGLVIYDNWTQNETSVYTQNGKGKTLYAYDPLASDGTTHILDSLSNNYQVSFESNGGNSTTAAAFIFHSNTARDSYYSLNWGKNGATQAWRLYKVTGGTQTMVASSAVLPTVDNSTYVKYMNATVTYQDGSITLDLAFGNTSASNTESVTWVDSEPFSYDAKDAMMGFTTFCSVAYTFTSMSVNDYVKANTNIVYKSNDIMVDTNNDGTCETNIKEATLSPLTEYKYEVVSNDTAVAATVTSSDRNVINVEDDTLVPLRSGSATLSVTGTVAFSVPVTVPGAVPYEMDFTAQTQFVDGSTSVSVAKGEKADLFTDWELNRESVYASSALAVSFGGGLWVPGKASAADGAITTANMDVPRLRYKGAIPEAYTFEVAYEKGSTLNVTYAQFMVHNNNQNYYEILTNDNTAYGSALCTTEVQWIFRKVVDGAVVESSIVQSPTSGHSGSATISVTVRGGSISWDVNGETGSYTDPNPFTVSPADTTIDFCACASSDGRGNTYKNFSIVALPSDDTVLSRVDGDYVKVYYNAANAGTTTTPKMLLVPYVASSVTGVNTIGKVVAGTPEVYNNTNFATASFSNMHATTNDGTWTKATPQVLNDDWTFDASGQYGSGLAYIYQKDTDGDGNADGLAVRGRPGSGGNSTSETGVLESVPQLNYTGTVPAAYKASLTFQKESSINANSFKIMVHNDGKNYYEIITNDNSSYSLMTMTNEAPWIFRKVVDGAVTYSVQSTQEGYMSNGVDATIELSINGSTVSWKVSGGGFNDETGSYTDASPFSVTPDQAGISASVRSRDYDNQGVLYKNFTLTEILNVDSNANATVMDAVNTTGDAFNMISIKKTYGDTFKFFAWDLGANLKNLVNAKSISK